MMKMTILSKNKIKYITNDILSSDLFNIFYKDLKKWKEVTKDILKTDKVYPMLKDCESIPKEKIPIFKLDPSLLEDINLKDFNLKKIVFPFEYLFIETPIIIEYKGDILLITGFLVSKHKYKNLEILRSYYVRSWTFKNEFNFSYLEDVNWRGMEGSVFPNIKGYSKYDELGIKIASVIRKKILGLLYLISKKEYFSYKKYTNKGYIKKEIINSRKVISHKRHFWKDSGRFKIPYMSKEELEEKGYEIDEIVRRDDEIRLNVPYRVIDDFETKGNNNKKVVKKREFLSKRQLRKENQLFNLLQKKFPNEYIKRHDRRRLNGLELDFYIHSLKLAFEYDGEQHFDRNLCEQVFKSDFDELKKRDRKKDKLCNRLGIKLIRIKYDMPLNITLIKKLLK